MSPSISHNKTMMAGVTLVNGVEWTAFYFKINFFCTYENTFYLVHCTIQSNPTATNFLIVAVNELVREWTVKLKWWRMVTNKQFDCSCLILIITGLGLLLLLCSPFIRGNKRKHNSADWQLAAKLNYKSKIMNGMKMNRCDAK